MHFFINRVGITAQQKEKYFLINYLAVSSLLF